MRAAARRDVRQEDAEKLTVLVREWWGREGFVEHGMLVGDGEDERAVKRRLVRSATRYVRDERVGSPLAWLLWSFVGRWIVKWAIEWLIDELLSDDGMRQQWRTPE